MSAPATRSASIASSSRSRTVSTRTRPRPTRKKPTPSSAVAPAAPRRAERGKASSTSVATRHAPPKSSSRTSSWLAPRPSARHRGERAEHDGRDHAPGQHAPHRTRGHARVREGLADPPLRGLVDGPDAPPASRGRVHLRGPLPRDRLPPHRSRIRRCAQKISASTADPSRAASRKGTLSPCRP